MAQKEGPTKVVLTEDEMPRKWCVLGVADLADLLNALLMSTNIAGTSTFVTSTASRQHIHLTCHPGPLQSMWMTLHTN